MVHLKRHRVSVTCMECKASNEILLKEPIIDKEQRSIGFEYEYTYLGESTCECGEVLKLMLEVYEYPKGIQNYTESTAGACVIKDTIKIEVNDK